MFRVEAPLALRSHPLVTGLLLCARHLNQRHTVVFTHTPPVGSLKSFGRPRPTVKGLAEHVRLSIDGGPTLIAPTILSAALALKANGLSSVENETLGKLSMWEQRTSSVSDAFDEMLGAITIQHYTGVMAANDALCEAMRALDACAGEGEGAASPSAAAVAEGLETCPLVSLVEFLGGDARMPLTPYPSVHAVATRPSEALKRTRALLRSTMATFPPATRTEDTPFTNIVPSSYALIRKVQADRDTAAEDGTLAGAKGRNHGSVGFQSGTPRSVLRPASPGSIRRPYE